GGRPKPSSPGPVSPGRFVSRATGPIPPWCPRSRAPLRGGRTDAMKPARTAFALLAVPVVAACDPTYSVSGTVVDASGAALAGATVTMACPSGRSEVVLTTGIGEFAFG